MPSYRPITDTWILGRPKVKYHGAYPGGFLHRARQLMGVRPRDPVLHVCAGLVRKYPYRGLGRRDRTVDIDPETRPDFVLDVRDRLPRGPWQAVLIDRPYDEKNAAMYAAGAASLPALNPLLARCLELVPVGQCVGVLDYKWPDPKISPRRRPIGREVAIVGVGTGRNSTARWFSVWERLS